MKHKKGKIHAANIDKSPRLRRVLSLLKRRKSGYTTMEIIALANVCNPNTCASELRENGYDVICECVGRDLYRYRIGH